MNYSSFQFLNFFISTFSVHTSTQILTYSILLPTSHTVFSYPPHIQYSLTHLTYTRILLMRSYILEQLKTFYHINYSLFV